MTHRRNSSAALLLTLAGVALASAACVTPLLMAESSTPLEGRLYQVTGPVDGESCQIFVLGIPVSGEASLRTALERARGHAADAVIDVVVDEWMLHLFFYGERCTQVHGRGIRFTDQPAPYMVPMPSIPSAPAGPAAPARPAEPAKPAASAKPAGPAKAEPGSAKPASADGKAGAYVPVDEDLAKTDSGGLPFPEPDQAKPETPPPEKKLTKAERAALERQKRAEEKKRQAEEKKRAAEEKKLQAEQSKLAAEAAAKAKVEADARAKAEAEARARAEEESRPVPADFQAFCKFQPGELVRIEAKAEKVQGEFIRCLWNGVRVKTAAGEQRLVAFETIWTVTKAPPPPPPEPAAPGGPAVPAPAGGG
jgi:hypothetical protein